MTTPEPSVMLTQPSQVRDDCIWALHGFGGSRSDFNALKKHLPVRPIDLPGHGSFTGPQNPSGYTTEAQIDWLASILPPRPVRLLGYSMGGRLALQFATTYPKRVSVLILIGTHSGLRNESERRERQIWDENKAVRVLRLGTAGFMEEWAELPIIATQKKYMPQADFEAMTQRRKTNCETSLSASLRGFGAGTMPSCWDRLQDVLAPTLLLAGIDDERYQKIHVEMASELPHARTHVVAQAGHAPHLSNPNATARIICQFLAESEAPSC